MRVKGQTAENVKEDDTDILQGYSGIYKTKGLKERTPLGGRSKYDSYIKQETSWANKIASDKERTPLEVKTQNLY